VEVDERIILKFILKKYAGRLWAPFIWLGLGTNDCIL
jgi:hypothetical protein